jgi:hypothetical protein
VSEAPRHSSLEAGFAAVVPPQRAPWTRRVLWWLLLRALALPPVQRIIEKKYGT